MPIIEEIQESNLPPHPHRRRLQHADTHAECQTPPGVQPPPPQSLPNPKPNTNSGPMKLLFIFLKWVIMTFILSLFLVFLGFAAVVILHFLLTGSAVEARRRRRLSQSPLNSAAPPSRSIQDLIPCLCYSASAQTTRDCAICLEGFKEGDLCRKLPDCTHLFHANCVDSWLAKKPNCPVCRARVQPVWWTASGSMNSSDDEWKFWWPVGA